MNGAFGTNNASGQNTYIHAHIHAYIHYVTLHYSAITHITIHYIRLHYITCYTYMRHTYKDRYIHIRAYMHTDIRKDRQTDRQTDKRTHICTHIHTVTCILELIHTYIYIHAGAHLLCYQLRTRFYMAHPTSGLHYATSDCAMNRAAPYSGKRA